MGHTKDERKKFHSHFTCHDQENDVLQKFSQKGCDNKELHAELSSLILKLQMQAFSSQRHALTSSCMYKVLLHWWQMHYFCWMTQVKIKVKAGQKHRHRTRFTNMVQWFYVTPVIQDSYKTRLTNLRLLCVTRKVQSSWNIYGKSILQCFTIPTFSLFWLSHQRLVPIPDAVKNTWKINTGRKKNQEFNSSTSNRS